MASINRLILLLIVCAGGAFAQGYTLENFANCTTGSAPTVTCLQNSWWGTGTSGGNSPVDNSNNTLTIVTTTVCDSGSMPPGHSGKVLNYNTTQGNGHNNQMIFLQAPVSSVGTIWQGAFWFCSNIPNTDSFGTSFDGFQLITGGGSRLSNYDSNGVSQGWGIETNAGQSLIPYTPGTWVLVVWQFVQGGACSNSDHSDCVRLRLYSRTGVLAGEQWFNGGSNVAVANMTFGNGNAATMSAGNAVQYADIWTATQGGTSAEFPYIPFTNPWDGIITPGRAINWTLSGISGGIPSSSWTQCGSTLAAGTYSGATLTSSLAGCGANTFYKLGVGTFNVNGTVTGPTAGSVVFRGSGAGSTFVKETGTAAACVQSTSIICWKSSDGTNTQSPGTVSNWTAGYVQGSNQITVSSTTGIVVNSTMIMLDQCDTGFSGGTSCPTGSATDNGNLFICGVSQGAGVGCSGPGPDAGGLRPLRGQMEIHTVTNVTGSVLTISPPLIFPNWASGQSPQMWIVQPVSNFGVEDMTIDGNGSSAAIGIEFGSAYNWWIKGVAVRNIATWGTNCFQCANGIFQSSYVFGMDNAANPYGVRVSFAANNIFHNNIIQSSTTPFSYDGSASGNVFANNFVINAAFQTPSNVLQAAMNYHAQDYFNLDEGNIMSQTDCDGVHGTCSMATSFRDLFTGWESQPGTPKTAFTNTYNAAFGDRYEHIIAAVYGTSGYHTAYNTITCPENNNAESLFNTSCPYFSSPTDTLGLSTSLLWGSYDIKRATISWCGTLLDTGWSVSSGCNSTSEAPIAAPVYANFAPVVGDTVAGQPSLPASFYLASRPSWWTNTIPYPAIGPDVSGGNVGQCSGTLNTSGHFSGVAATSSAQCTGTSLTSAWAGHVNANPAMVCALSLGMPPDGTGSALAFDEATCYGGTPPSSGATPKGTGVGKAISTGIAEPKEFQ